MRYFFDTEFIEDGKTIDLISIGIVSEDGRQYYAENIECDKSKASDWVKENVFPHLVPGNSRLRSIISKEIVDFTFGERPEFWAYFADYDWVVLCQLYGTMMDLPKDWPMFCMDLKQASVMKGDIRFPKQGSGAHYALADAQWCRRMYNEYIR